MPKLSFYLKRPGGTAPTSIFLTYQCIDGILKYYTDIAIKPNQWDKVNQISTKHTVNVALNKIRQAVEKYTDNTELVTKEALRLEIVYLSAKPDKKPLYDTWQSLITQMERGEVLTPGKKRYSLSSLKTLRFTVDLVQRFRPDPPALDMRFYNQFIRWCQTELDASTNYIGAQLKNIKSLSRLSGLDLPPGFKKITENTFDIYLSAAELEAMNKAELTERETLVRDWFVLDCNLGLRISDIGLLTDRNISGDLITIANEKTDEKVVIPVNAAVRAILLKYGGFPPKVTDVEMNRVIKQVARKAGITGKVLHTITKGGKRVDSYLEKWQMVSNHTARRSFITNLRKSGVADSIVMKLTGIKSVNTLLRYDKMNADEAAEVARGLEFFR